MPDYPSSDCAHTPALAEETVILSFGSNIGNGRKNIDTAVDFLRKNEITIEKTSSFYRTSPVGTTCRQDFVNSAAAVRTKVSPARLLEICKKIENLMGRDPEAPRWSDRIIDIDILFFGSRTIDTPELKIPHPGFQDRLFAIKTAADAAPDFVAPDGRTLSDFLSAQISRSDFYSQIVEIIPD